MINQLVPRNYDTRLCKNKEDDAKEQSHVYSTVRIYNTFLFQCHDREGVSSEREQTIELTRGFQYFLNGMSSQNTSRV